MVSVAVVALLGGDKCSRPGRRRRGVGSSEGFEEEDGEGTAAGAVDRVSALLPARRRLPPPPSPPPLPAPLPAPGLPSLPGEGLVESAASFCCLARRSAARAAMFRTAVLGRAALGSGANTP